MANYGVTLKKNSNYQKDEFQLDCIMSFALHVIRAFQAAIDFSVTF